MGKAELWTQIRNLEARINQCQIDIARLNREIEELEACKFDRTRTRDAFGENMHFRQTRVHSVSGISDRAKSGRSYYKGMSETMHRNHAMLDNMESALQDIQQEINIRYEQIGALNAEIGSCGNQIAGCQHQISAIQAAEAAEAAQHATAKRK
jgi:chromosome segregation ATPase